MLKNANFFITEFFRSLIGKQTAENITPKIADAIQKQDFFHNQNTIDKTYTPSYLPISYQLLNDKKEIFNASVYYLCKIAQNSPKYKLDIINILNTYCKNNKNNKERVDFIKSEMEKHHLKHNL